VSPSEPTRRSGRRWLAALLVVLCIAVLGWILRGPVLVTAAAFLDVGEEPAPADLIYVLGGGVFSRVPAAAELYRGGFAPAILLARIQDNDATRIGVYPNETDAIRNLLVTYGVPDSAIVVVRRGSGVNSTTDEAVVLREFLVNEPAGRVLVVTNDFHTRRARWNMRRQLKGFDTEIRMISAPDPRFTGSDWWRSEEGMLVYVEEYLKFVHNWMFR
jgi:uncharacterized SAM-binding protein YcdF (DUF218 family)